MKPVSQNTLRRAINTYTAAELANSWKGGGDPDDWPAIELRLKRARARLDLLLRALPIPLDARHFPELMPRRQ